MQRLPDYMRDMLSTRNPSDNWNRTMATTTPGNDGFPNVMVHTPNGAIATIPYWTLRTIINEAMRSKQLDDASYDAARSLVDHLIKTSSDEIITRQV